MKRYVGVFFFIHSFFVTHAMNTSGVNYPDSDGDIFYSCEEDMWDEQLSTESDSDDECSLMDKMIWGKGIVLLKKKMKRLRYSLSDQDFCDLNPYLEDKDASAIQIIVDLAHAHAVRRSTIRYLIKRVDMDYAIKKHKLRASRLFYY